MLIYLIPALDIHISIDIFYSFIITMYNDLSTVSYPSHVYNLKSKGCLRSHRYRSAVVVTIILYRRFIYSFENYTIVQRYQIASTRLPLRTIIIIRLLKSFFFLQPSCYLRPHSIRQGCIMYCVDNKTELLPCIRNVQRRLRWFEFLEIFIRAILLLLYNDRKSKWWRNYMGFAQGLFNLPETLLVSPCLDVHAVYYNVLGSFKFTVNYPRDFGLYTLSFYVSPVGHIYELTDYSRVSIIIRTVCFPRVCLFLMSRLLRNKSQIFI